jgi:hypothetical protein
MMHHINPEFVISLGAFVVVWFKVSQDRQIGRLEGKVDALNTVVMGLLNGMAQATPGAVPHGPRSTD